MRHTVSTYFRLLSINFRGQLQYRVSFLFELIGTGLIALIEFGSLALVFERFGDFKGWSIAEVAFLYGGVEMAFGLMDMIFSGFDPPNFGQLVRKGTFDQLLLRPINITTQVLGADFAFRRIGKIVVGGIILGISIRTLGLHLSVLQWIYLGITIVSMVLFFGGLFIAGATITFWTVESVEIMNVFTYGGSFLISHPMHIYQDWIRRFFTFVLPAIFLNYYPALYFLGKPDPFNFPAFAPFLSPFAGIVILLLSLAFWRFGMKFYQSTGS
jgi:ABC-2 type transport system permease protein